MFDGLVTNPEPQIMQILVTVAFKFTLHFHFGSFWGKTNACL